MLGVHPAAAATLQLRMGGDLAAGVQNPHMADDEHELCYGVRKSNCIYPGFVAAHLSFWKQDAAMNVPATLRKYEALSQSCGV